MPSEHFKRYVPAFPEGAEQIKHRPSRKAGSNLVKQRRRGYSYPLGNHVMQGEADHRVTSVFGLEDVAERDRQESIAETFG